MRQRKINIITLGCSKNLVDSELLMGQLTGFPFRLYHDSGKPSDTVIINTCGFINDAKQESIDTILQYSEAKRRGEINKLFVMGCLPQRFRSELEAELSGVDGYFGVDQLKDILSGLGVNYRKELAGERMLTTPSHYAWIKIAEGCDRKCSFCAIPLIRGPHRSRKIKDIVDEAGKLAGKNVKELILISQDTTYYGMDIYGKKRLAQLLGELSEIEGIEWIRIQYTYPAGFPEDILEVMQSSGRICRYIDMPLQHIDGRILRSMKRGIGEKQTCALIDRIRKKVPGVALRTTLITGYPGEGEREFTRLKDFIRNVEFERLGAFAYSAEEGTPAWKLKDSVPEKVKRSRLEELMAIQQEISHRNNLKMIGKVIKVIVDRDDPDYYFARGEFDSPEVDNEILIKKDEIPEGYPINYQDQGKSPGTGLSVGEIIKVKVTGAEPFDLFAIPVI